MVTTSNRSSIAIALAITAAFGAVGLAQSREFRFAVSGSGSATASDRQEALDEAYDKASDQARTVCGGGNGQAHRIERTGSNCTALGSSDNQRYSCMVFVRAECVTRVR
jgi:hypothetical protein